MPNSSRATKGFQAKYKTNMPGRCRDSEFADGTIWPLVVFKLLKYCYLEWVGISVAILAQALMPVQAWSRLKGKVLALEAHDNGIHGLQQKLSRTLHQPSRNLNQRNLSVHCLNKFAWPMSSHRFAIRQKVQQIWYRRMQINWRKLKQIIQSSTMAMLA